MALQPRKQLIAIHILPNISRSKGNQAIKFGQWLKSQVKSLEISRIKLAFKMK